MTNSTCATNSQPQCANKVCTFACSPGFHDLDGQAANGYEYACFASGVEVCDGDDNDCDGQIDEPADLLPPDICRSGGECGATAPTATCTGMGGWVCNYLGAVEFPEVSCDGKNNGCDANIDESHPGLGQACNDGRQGVCQGTGTLACNAANPTGAAVCNITSPGQTNPDAQETCDDKDNDCDGQTDEGADTGSLFGQDWVDIGGGKQMMKYEASKPDSSATDQGTRNTFACSKAGVQPWINVRYPDALAACQAIGATLCSEPQWHRACSVVAPTTYPLAVSGAATYIEAEDYSGTAYASTPAAPSAESGSECSESAGTASDDDGDAIVNDGCPAQGIVGPYSA